MEIQLNNAVTVCVKSLLSSYIPTLVHYIKSNGFTKSEAEIENDLRLMIPNVPAPVATQFTATNSFNIPAAISNNMPTFTAAPVPSNGETKKKSTKKDADSKSRWITFDEYMKEYNEGKKVCAYQATRSSGTLNNQNKVCGNTKLEIVDSTDQHGSRCSDCKTKKGNIEKELGKKQNSNYMAKSAPGLTVPVVNTIPGLSAPALTNTTLSLNNLPNLSVQQKITGIPQQTTLPQGIPILINQGIPSLSQLTQGVPQLPTNQGVPSLSQLTQGIPQLPTNQGIPQLPQTQQQVPVTLPQIPGISFQNNQQFVSKLPNLATQTQTQQQSVPALQQFTIPQTPEVNPEPVLVFQQQQQIQQEETTHTTQTQQEMIETFTNPNLPGVVYPLQFPQLAIMPQEDTNSFICVGSLNFAVNETSEIPSDWVEHLLPIDVESAEGQFLKTHKIFYNYKAGGESVLF